MNRQLKIWLVAAAALLATFLFFRFNDSGTQLLWSWSEGGKWLLPLVSVAALLDSINPCAISVLIITIAFVFSLGEDRRRAWAIGGAYILGLFLVYLLIGLGLLRALHLFGTPHFMSKVAAVVLILWGAIGLISHFFPNFPIKLKIPAVAHSKMAVLLKRGSLPAAIALGALVGLCEFPCTGGPYLLVLGLLHDQATYLAGFAYLLWYNLLFVSPLIVILAITSNKVLLEKVSNWRKSHTGAMHLYGGIAMIILGLIILNL